MADGDDGLPLFFILASIPIGWGSAAIGWDAVLNMPAKKKLLDQYATEGIDVTAFVLQQNVATYRTNFTATRKKHLIRYAYKEPPGSDQVCIRDYVKWHATCCAEIEAMAPVFAVKVLPGHPRSGIPKFRVEEREGEYGEMARTAAIVKATLGVTLGSLMFMTSIGDAYTPVFFLLPYLLFVLLGGLCVPCMFDGWKREILEKVVEQSSAIQLPRLRRREYHYAPVATTVILHQEAAQETNIPLVAATPVGPARTAYGNRVVRAMECGTARAVKIEPPVPDQLAEAIMTEACNLSFQTLLESLDQFREGMWDYRSTYVDLAATNWASQSLSPLVGCPDNAVGNLFKGVYYIHRSWDVRGSSTANNVERDAWPQFHRGLAIARDALLRAAEQDPEDPTPYSYLAGAMAKGLQVGEEQSREWFEAAITRDPLSRSAHFGRLSVLCKKWGGSHEAMFSFARETRKKSSKDCPLHLILFLAFYEQWLYLNSILRQKRAAQRYLQQPGVQSETVTIYRQAMENRSIIEDASQVSWHCEAAKWLLLTGHKETAKNELDKLRPWKKMIGDPIVSTALARN